MGPCSSGSDFGGGFGGLAVYRLVVIVVEEHLTADVVRESSEV
jgi:hypothetical protein